MSGIVKIKFNLDGSTVQFDCSPDSRLLDLIREDAGITAVREGCGEGECGACSILLDGKLINSCSTPAINAHGKNVLTSQGFSNTEEYKIISGAFAEAGAVQCGFCTPGFIMATAALLMNNEAPTDHEIKTALSGNLCRCTGYTMIVDAVRLAAIKLKNCDKSFFKKINSIDSIIAEKTETDNFLPENITDALKLLNNGYKPIAGGTDLLVRKHALMKASGNTADFPRLFSTSKIAGFNHNQKCGNADCGILKIGAGVKISELIDFPDCPMVLKEALKSIASPGIRNAATLAGNICNASPAGDSLPALYILDAEIFYYTLSDNRPVLKSVPIKDFITGPGKTILDKTIVSSININAEDGYLYSYKKLGTREANALSKLSIAAMYKRDNNSYTDFRLAIGACGPTVVRNLEAEKILIEEGLCSIEKVIALYSKVIKPIDDQRSTAEYRKNTSLKLIKDILINPEKYSC